MTLVKEVIRITHLTPPAHRRICTRGKAYISLNWSHRVTSKPTAKAFRFIILATNLSTLLKRNANRFTSGVHQFWQSSQKQWGKETKPYYPPVNCLLQQCGPRTRLECSFWRKLELGLLLKGHHGSWFCPKPWFWHCLTESPLVTYDIGWTNEAGIGRWSLVWECWREVRTPSLTMLLWLFPSQGYPLALQVGICRENQSGY